MEKFNYQGELMLKKVIDEIDRDIIRELLIEFKYFWENLGEKIVYRQVRLEQVIWVGELFFVRFDFLINGFCFVLSSISQKVFFWFWVSFNMFQRN